jgi:hypothetical protein
MVSVHVALGVAVLAICGGAAVLGLVAYRRGVAGPWVAQALALAQTVLIGQAAVGLLLLSDGRRAPDRLLLYGAIALGRARHGSRPADTQAPALVCRTTIRRTAAARAFATGS